MSALHFIAVCMGIMTVFMVVLAVLLAVALWQLQRTVKAVEASAHRFGSQLTKWEGVAGALGGAALAATGGWVRSLGTGLGLAYSAFRFFRKKRGNEES